MKKCTQVKIILKNLVQKKKLGMHPLVTHCLQVVHLTPQKNKLDCYKGEDCIKIL